VKVAMVFWTEIPPDRLDQIPTRLQRLMTHVLIRILGVQKMAEEKRKKERAITSSEVEYSKPNKQMIDLT
jgi:hypothetical protein